MMLSFAFEWNCPNYLLLANPCLIIGSSECFVSCVFARPKKCWRICLPACLMSWGNLTRGRAGGCRCRCVCVCVYVFARVSWDCAFVKMQMNRALTHPLAYPRNTCSHWVHSLLVKSMKLFCPEKLTYSLLLLLCVNRWGWSSCTLFYGSIVVCIVTHLQVYSWPYQVFCRVSMLVSFPNIRDMQSSSCGLVSSSVRSEII